MEYMQMNQYQSPYCGSLLSTKRRIPVLAIAQGIREAKLIALQRGKQFVDPGTAT